MQLASNAYTCARVIKWRRAEKKTKMKERKKRRKKNYTLTEYIKSIFLGSLSLCLLCLDLIVGCHPYHTYSKRKIIFSTFSDCLPLCVSRIAWIERSFSILSAQRSYFCPRSGHRHLIRKSSIIAGGDRACKLENSSLARASLEPFR